MTCGYLVTVAYTAALYVRDIASKQRLLLTVFHGLVSVDSRHMHVLSDLISSRVHVYIAAVFEVTLTPAMLQPYVQRISSKQSCKNALFLAKNAQCFVVAHLEARPKAVAICCVSCPEYRSRQLMLRKRMDHKHTALLFETQNNTWHLHQSEPRPMPHNHDHAHKAEADGTKRPWRLPKICDFLEAMSMM